MRRHRDGNAYAAMTPGEGIAAHVGVSSAARLRESGSCLVLVLVGLVGLVGLFFVLFVLR
jgi:hypothetical protein